MSAKELFEALGYQEEPIYFKIKTYCKVVYKDDWTYHVRIKFYETIKTVEKTLSYYSIHAGVEEWERHLTIEEIKAIHKQLEELGWL